VGYMRQTAPIRWNIGRNNRQQTPAKQPTERSGSRQHRAPRPSPAEVRYSLTRLNGLPRSSERLLDTSVQMLRNVPHLAIIPLVFFGSASTRPPSFSWSQSACSSRST
jgi:hypothetical protein